MTRALFLALALSGCATPAELCGMRDEVDVSVVPIGFTVNAVVNVVTPEEAKELCTPIGKREARYGCNTGTAEHGVVYVTRWPKFSDVCSEAKLGHELLHPHASHQ